MKAEQTHLFNEGIRLFNAAEFYEAHEAWEAIWLKEEGADRRFYQGLIQLAASFHHFQKGRLHEGHIAWERAAIKLSEYPDGHHGLNLAKLLQECGAWIRGYDPKQPYPRME